MLRSSGVDIWTLIDTAISVAAMDYGDDLKLRRDGIVERLYAPPVSRRSSSSARDRQEEAKASTGENEKSQVSPATLQSVSGEDSDEDDGKGLDPYGGLFDDEQKKILEIKEQIEESDQVSLISNSHFSTYINIFEFSIFLL